MSEAASGKKRPASPAGDNTKDLFDVAVGEDVQKKLDDITREVYRVEIANERAAQKRLAPIYEKRREIFKTVPKFWPVTLMNSSVFAQHVQHADDQKALLALEDVWIERDPIEHRAFTIEFHFGENPYFSDKVLKKAYTYMPPDSAKDEKPDENGVTDSAADFDWERDVAPQKTTISWKSDAVNLTKLQPRVFQDGELAEPGSFFNWFEEEGDPLDLGITITNEIFPEAAEIFTGKYEMSLTDDEDSEEEDDDDEADEIDLEKPEPKKRRKV